MLVGREVVCRGLPDTAMLLKRHNNTLPLPFTQPPLLPCHPTPHTSFAATNSDAPHQWSLLSLSGKLGGFHQFPLPNIWIPCGAFSNFTLLQSCRKARCLDKFPRSSLLPKTRISFPHTSDSGCIACNCSFSCCLLH